MKILIDRSFERDSKRLPAQAQSQLREIIEKLKLATSLQEVSPTKMEGAKNAYRIRFGNYRIGFYLEGNEIVLSRAINRKEVYRYFPKKK